MYKEPIKNVWLAMYTFVRISDGPRLILTKKGCWPGLQPRPALRTGLRYLRFGIDPNSEGFFAVLPRIQNLPVLRGNTGSVKPVPVFISTFFHDVLLILRKP